MFFRELVKRLSSWLQPAPRQLMIADYRAPAAPEAARAAPARQAVAQGPAVADLQPRTPDAPVMRTSTGRALIYRAFNSTLPVEDRYGLSGRKAEMAKLADAILAQHKHGIIFGSRGSGKTSLARVFGDHADEAGYTVAYSSVSGDLPFADIFRPYFVDLPGAERGGAVARSIAELKGRPFDVRDLAGLLTEVRTRTLLVLDEFDLIVAQKTKDEIASLLKLLTDMHSRVQLLVIGIAGNVEDLLNGHPSLRRHMVAVPIGPISTESLKTLIGNCAEAAGMTIAPDAIDLLAEVAMGSPYHGRLFGLQAAVAANAAGRTEIMVRDVESGFAAALDDWSGMSVETHRTVRDALGQIPDSPVLLTSIAVAAAFHSTFDVNAIVGLCDKYEPRDGGWAAPLAELFGWIQPILRKSGPDGTLMLQDTLAPQFIRLMMRPRPVTQAPEDTIESNLPGEFRAALGGLRL